MKLGDLKNKLEGKIDGFAPTIIVLEHIETGDKIDKLAVVEIDGFKQVFGVTQKVLDVINLTDDELVHYITEWVRACGGVLSEYAYRSLKGSMIK